MNILTRGVAGAFFVTEQNMATEFRDKLFCLIRAGMGLKVNPVSLLEDEYEKLKLIGERQSIQPILLNGLEKTGAPEMTIQKFDQACLRDIHQIVQHDIALDNICAVLDEVKVPYVLLKGAALRNLYPDLSLRTSCDIDVLVHEEDLEKAIDIIEACTDFKKQQRNYHDVSMISSRVYLELHFSISENMKNIDQILDHVWDYAQPSENGFRYDLTPEFQIFHVIAHMSYHMVHGGIGIRMYLDLWLLRTHLVYDEKTVCQMCDECGILQFYQVCCDLIGVWMEEREYTDKTKVLEDFCLSGGVFGTTENAAASRLREKNVSGHIFSRLFASKTIMEKEYPELKTKPYLLPICQVKRWTRLLNKQKRQQIRNEVRNVKLTSKDSIESFDKVMKELGL